MTSGGLNAAKWAGKVLLQIPVYFVTAYVMRALIGGCYHLLVRAGANLPPYFLLSHFLWVSFVGGFLAGLVGLLIFRAMLLLPLQTEPANGIPWKRPQAWTWVLPACWLAFGIFAWAGKYAHHSVLAVSSGAGASGLVAVFFGSGCSLASGDFRAIALGSCMTQVTFTHPWLGTLGYSAAALAPAGWFGRMRGSAMRAEHAYEPERSEPFSQ